jgi:GntR family transcriptional regulator
LPRRRAGAYKRRRNIKEALILDLKRDLARDRRIPIWRAIERHLREMIGGPGFGPGARVPSERALAEQLGANRMTVRKAVESLVAQGLLERHGTGGTRIPLPRVTRPVDNQASLGMTRLIQISGGTPGNKLLHFAEARATEPFAARLAVPEGSDLIVIRRLWTVNATPFCIETNHIPATFVPGLAAEDLTAGQSLYALLRSRYGIATVNGERTIGVAACSPLEARLLNLAPGSPSLLLRLLIYDEAGRPVDDMTSVNHPDLVVFQTAKTELT